MQQPPGPPPWPISLTKDEVLRRLGEKFAGMQVKPCWLCGSAPLSLRAFHWTSADPDALSWLVAPRPGSLLARVIESPAEAAGRGGVEGEAMFVGPAPAPGWIPCAVFACGKCGNMYMLDLTLLGVWVTNPPRLPPALKIVRGEGDVNEVPDPGNGRGERV